MSHYMVEWLALKYLATYSPSFGGVYIAGHEVLNDSMPHIVGRSPHGMDSVSIWRRAVGVCEKRTWNT
jgi:hypothetical protein